MVSKTIDGVSFELKEDFDFGFLAGYGQVFTVFDEQDSGHLCFGVRSAGRKLFLKLAGASTVRSNTTPGEAVSRLKSTVTIYEDLRHPSLIDMVEHREVDGGYLTVFDWFDGVPMGRQYGRFEQFTALPTEKKMALYREILHFHSHVNRRGYIAVDFYDGCVMYNFESERTMLCDIEFYGKKPLINTMGRMWGSGRYMSPEEFQLGAVIDERSNVFAMGAAAFQLLGGGMERDAGQWTADGSRYDIALKAVNREKSDRYQTIDDYLAAWDNA